MRKLNVIVFDDILNIPSGTSVTAYTKPELNDALGMNDQLAIQVVTDNLTNAPGSPSVTARIQHSADQLNWAYKNGSADVTNTPAALSTTSAVGADGGATPSLGYVRLEIKFTIASGTASVHVKVWVTARNQGG